jgi:hypothetical protein
VSNSCSQYVETAVFPLMWWTKSLCITFNMFVSSWLTLLLLQFRFVKSLPKKYAHTRPVGADEGWEVCFLVFSCTSWLNVNVQPISPLQVQSCTYRINVPISGNLITALAAEVPEDDDIVTPFDVWVHLSLFSFSSDGPSHFNTAWCYYHNLHHSLTAWYFSALILLRWCRMLLHVIIILISLYRYTVSSLH